MGSSMAVSVDEPDTQSTFSMIVKPAQATEPLQDKNVD